MDIFGLVFLTCILLIHHFVYLYGMVSKADWYYYPEKAKFKWLISHQTIRGTVGVKGLVVFGIIQLVFSQSVYWYVVLDMLKK
jgi:hypothetical protein